MSVVRIEYCRAWKFDSIAARLAEEIKMQYSGKVADIEVVPSELSGIFDVYLDDELIYSKLKGSGRLPKPGEVEQILFERLMKK